MIDEEDCRDAEVRLPENPTICGFNSQSVKIGNG